MYVLSCFSVSPEIIVMVSWTKQSINQSINQAWRLHRLYSSYPAVKNTAPDGRISYPPPTLPSRTRPLMAG